MTLGSLKFLATPPALYDLARDPDQQQNLLTSRPATALHLESVLIERSAGTSKADSVDDATLRNLRTLEYLR